MKRTRGEEQCGKEETGQAKERVGKWLAGERSQRMGKEGRSCQGRVTKIWNQVERHGKEAGEHYKKRLIRVHMWTWS